MERGAMRTINGYTMAIDPSRAIKRIRRTTHQLQHFLALYRLIRVVQPYTMVDHSRLIILYGLAREVVAKGIEGDIVECGVCNGGSAALLAVVIRDYQNYKLFLYDTFEGIPPSGLKDGPFADKFEGKFRGQ